MSDSEPSHASEDGVRAPGDVRSEPSPEPPGGAMARGVGPLALVLVAGVCLPPHWGLAIPLLLALVAAAVGGRRMRRWPAAHAAMVTGTVGGSVRRGLLAVTLLVLAVLSTVFARGVGTLVVEFPAAIWGAGAMLGAATLWAVVAGRLSARGRPVVLLVLAAAVPLAGIGGTRYEEAGASARGWAHSGPILGIHPFQSTSIIVDGFGPFDLPINDYVEPDGSRGYDPEGLADAIDRALESIAQRVYPEGPARARRAFLDATVEAVRTPAVWETLDQPPLEDTQARFVVHSGSFGRHSRVEFVCPGRRIDPRRSQEGESVMNTMCPTKYAAEASAGLGVTGRWSGYTEQRGRDRVGLFALGEWTRSDDRAGDVLREREAWAWAWAVLLLVAVVVVVPRPGARLGDGLRGLGGALGAMAAVGLVMGVMGAVTLGRGPSVGLGPDGPPWPDWPPVHAWTPALALAAAPLFALGSTAPPRPANPSASGPRVVLPLLVVTVATVLVAAALPALPWATSSADSLEPWLPRFVVGLAEAVGERGGLTIFEVEGLVASGLVGLLLGAAVAVGRSASAVVRPLVSTAFGSRAILVLVMLAVAAPLVVSRKTAGAAALVPGVLAVAIVLGSSWQRISSPRTGWALAAHAIWCIGGVVVLVTSLSALPADPFVTRCMSIGVVAILVAGIVGVLPVRSARVEPP